MSVVDMPRLASMSFLMMFGACAAEVETSYVLSSDDETSDSNIVLERELTLDEGVMLEAEGGEFEIREVAAPDDIAETEAAAIDAQVLCSGTSNPFSGGPRCCPRWTVLRPSLQRCQAAWDLSPLRDGFGAYNGFADRPNFLAVGSNTLQVCAAYVFDNGEGAFGVHGPEGNLYVDFFAPTEPLGSSPDGADHRRLGPPRQLRGPHRTHDTTDEWNDDELQRYRNAGVFQWGGRTAIVLRVWESDGSEDGSWGRRNDVLGMERITRASTLGGIWVPLHKYTNDHPRRRTTAITGMLLLRTGGTCPR